MHTSGAFGQGTCSNSHRADAAESSFGWQLALGPSSLPSPQSFSPSQSQVLKTQRPLSHLKWSLGHWTDEQALAGSSLPSSQS